MDKIMLSMVAHPRWQELSASARKEVIDAMARACEWDLSVRIDSNAPASNSDSAGVKTYCACRLV